MKTLILLLLSSVVAFGQAYSTSTNLTITNTIEASVTLTYTGTNCLDVTRYRTFGLALTGAGTTTATNTITLSFLASPDNTNWNRVTRYTMTGSVPGTNTFAISTNFSANDDVGYVLPYQIVNGSTKVTNAWTLGIIKTFPRN